MGAQYAPTFTGPIQTSISPDATVTDTETVVTSPGVQPPPPTSTSGQTAPLVDTQIYPDFTVPGPSVSGPDAAVALTGEGRSPSAPGVPKFDAATHRPVADSALERPSYGHIPPHTNTPDGSVSDTSSVGPGTPGGSRRLSPP